MTGWRKLKLLGQGTYGRVFLAAPIYAPYSFKKTTSSSSSSPGLVAVKSAEYDSGLGVSSLVDEASFLAHLNGTPNVVHCFGEDTSVEGGRPTYNLLLEYASAGSLQDFIAARNGRGMPETHTAFYASMILRGLGGIHSRGIVHCDLKPANLLVFPEHVVRARGGTVYRLKLADFGLARRVSESEVRVYHQETKTFNRGTPLYSSPESLYCGTHDTCTDIWSLGCIVVEMLTGGKKLLISQYKNLDDLFALMFRYLGRDLSHNARDFLRRCLEREPHKRWSAIQLLEHPFIVNNLKIISQTYDFDLSGQNQHHCQENPFGLGKSWVSIKHLFSTNTLEETQQHPQQLQQEFRPYNLFPVNNSVQPVHATFQFPCGAAVVNLLKV